MCHLLRLLSCSAWSNSVIRANHLLNSYLAEAKRVWVHDIIVIISNFQGQSSMWNHKSLVTLSLSRSTKMCHDVYTLGAARCLTDLVSLCTSVILPWSFSPAGDTYSCKNHKDSFEFLGSFSLYVFNGKLWSSELTWLKSSKDDAFSLILSLILFHFIRFLSTRLCEEQ